MLRYNLTRIFKIRGVTRPYSFFSKLGFSPGTASKYTNSKFTTLNLQVAEKLCNLLGCTPNDIIEWTPDKPEDDRPDHPLYPLKKTDKATQVNQLIHSLSFNQLSDLEQIIKDLKKNNNPPTT